MGEQAVIYLLPGLLCDETVWEAQIKVLSRQAEVRVPSFRGMNSFREMAMKVLEDAPAKFSVVGHSMGGRVAMELMRLAPQKIDKFVLMDLGVHPLQAGEEDSRMKMVRLCDEKGMQALADVWIPPMIAASRRKDKALIDKITKMVLRSTPADHRGQIEAALTRQDQTLYLPKIKHKVLLICGEFDEWSTVSQHEEILKGLKHAELVIIPKAGHMVTMEEPAAVNRVLLEWFAG